MSPSGQGKTDPTKDGQKEDIIDLVGGEGPWQRLIFLLMTIMLIPEASHDLSMSFLAPNIDHWCARPPNFNSSLQKWKDIAIPPSDQHCSRYKLINFSHIDAEGVQDNTSNKETMPCDSWEYDHSIYISTIRSKWNLVCDREWLISLSKSIFIAGYLLQAIACGYLSDKFGRKPVIVVCNVLALISSVICAFSTTFLMFVVARIFLATGVAGASTTGFVLLMETTGTEFRSVYGIGICFGVPIGYFFLAAVAWWLRDGFWIQIVITVPSIIILSSCWLLPESPRWLLVNGKQDETLKVLCRAGKKNGLHPADIESKLKDVIADMSKEHETEKLNVNIFQLFKPELRIKTSIICFIWCVIAFVYFGITYNTNELAGDPFINFVLSGLVEIPATILTIFLTKSKGNRKTLAIGIVATGVCCLMMYPIPNDPWWISAILSSLAKFCITGPFHIVYVFTAEMYPTVLRNVGVGAGSMCARIGAVTAPFVKELGVATHPIVPQIVFGILAVTGGLLAMLLPETKNCSLPDTLKEAAEITR